MSDWHKLGLKLKEVREYLNLSQQYVSDRTGIPRSAVSDIERGERKVDSLELKKLAGLYRKPVGYFLDEEDTSDAGEHAIAALMRNLTKMTDENRKAIEAFAEFLVQDKATERERS
jgi:transcriptional regulator with XRE-family HTH domain